MNTATDTKSDPTADVLKEMLGENTGIHMLDSGGSSGRHWQHNQGRDFDADPEATMEIWMPHREGAKASWSITVNVYHFVRERLELLLDRDSPFLELSVLSAADSEFHTGASGVHGIGVVSGVECVITGHDPTVRGGSSNPYTLGKSLRAQDIARENRLPLINLVESGGVDLPHQHEVFVPGGKWFRNLTQLSKLGIPTITAIFD